MGGLSEYGPTDKEVAKEAFYQNQARSAVQIVATRYVIWFVALMLPAGMALAAWGGQRMISALDHTIEQQINMSQQIIKLQGVVEGVINLSVVTTKAINDRIDSGEKSVTSRFDAQGHWLQKSSEEIDKLKEKIWTLPSRGTP